MGGARIAGAGVGGKWAGGNWQGRQGGKWSERPRQVALRPLARTLLALCGGGAGIGLAAWPYYGGG
jgi:hypothetical protein